MSPVPSDLAGWICSFFSENRVAIGLPRWRTSQYSSAVKGICPNIFLIASLPRTLPYFTASTAMPVLTYEVFHKFSIPTGDELTPNAVRATAYQERQPHRH